MMPDALRPEPDQNPIGPPTNCTFMRNMIRISQMHLKTLGGLALAGGSFHRPLPLLLVAYLRLEGSKTRRELAEVFWPNAKDARDSLGTALRHLSAAGVSVESEGGRLSTAIPYDALDFLAAVREGRYQEATELYQGPFLQGLDLKLGE
jgi:DNA-binding SARP family transcriptional activator